MKSCKDCVHYNVCLDFRINICESCKKRHAEYRITAECICDFYTNKADVREVKHGHWIVHTFSNNKKFIECSICNAVIDCSKGFIDEDEYDYCPYCSAIMKAGAENGRC